MFSPSFTVAKSINLVQQWTMVTYRGVQRQATTIQMKCGDNVKSKIEVRLSSLLFLINERKTPANITLSLLQFFSKLLIKIIYSQLEFLQFAGIKRNEVSCTPPGIDSDSYPIKMHEISS